MIGQTIERNLAGLRQAARLNPHQAANATRLEARVTTVDIDKVAGIIREVADRVIMPRWRNLAAHEIGSKARPDDIVTIADREAEAELTPRLSALIPGSHVIGEEAVASDPGILERFRRDEPVWVIDPIDGTRKFTEGQTIFYVLVALLVGGRGVAGWIYQPAEQTMLQGETGSGVVRERQGEAPTKIRHHGREALADLTGIVTSRGFLMRGYPDPELVKPRFRDFTRHTCAGHNYARLLTGECDFLINFATLPWDHLAGLMLTREAGFHNARLDRAPFDPLDGKGGILVAPSESSWQEIVAALMPTA